MISDEITELRERVWALERELLGVQLDLIRLPKPQVTGMDMVPIQRSLGRLEGALAALTQRVKSLEAARPAPPPDSR